eukprot:11787887-Alexandrium_andersonii.AAC.1
MDVGPPRSEAEPSPPLVPAPSPAAVPASSSVGQQQLAESTGAEAPRQPVPTTDGVSAGPPG